MAAVRRESGGPLDDDATLLLVARRALGGSDDAGRASYRVVVTRCPDCRNASQVGQGASLRVDGAIAAMAACDAQHVEVPQTSANDAAALHAETTHAGSARFARATQSIPPATRRRVLARDRSCCVVPGCRNAVFVDVHHLRPRSEGGGHAPEDLVTLCAARHRAVHRGEIAIGPSAAGELHVTHADGSRYGGLGNPPTPGAAASGARNADTSAKLFGALRSLGFRETETRRAVSELQSHVGAGEPIESLLRRALRLLTERRAG